MTIYLECIEKRLQEIQNDIAENLDDCEYFEIILDKLVDIQFEIFLNKLSPAERNHFNHRIAENFRKFFQGEIE